MTAGAVGLGLAVLSALLDLAVPVGPGPRSARRLLRALPAGALAVTLRLADAPPLPAAALLAFATAAALAPDGGEPGVGALTVTLLAQLLLAAAVWELASPGLLLREPWRGGLGAALLAAGLAVLRLRPSAGPLRALAPLPVALLALSAVGAGVEGSARLALAFGAAATLWSAAEAARRWGGPAGGLGGAARALGSAAALAFALPLLPLPR